jgi:hypothetical protein
MKLTLPSISLIILLLTHHTTATATPCLQATITDYASNGSYQATLSLNNHLACYISRYTNTTFQRSGPNLDLAMTCLNKHEHVNATLQLPAEKFEGGTGALSVFVQSGEIGGDEVSGDEGVVVSVEETPVEDWEVENGVEYRTYHGEVGC